MKKWPDRIESDPQVLRGKPCLKGTRIPVALVLGYLAAQRTAEQILQQFPELTPADIRTCLAFSASGATYL